MTICWAAAQQSALTVFPFVPRRSVFLSGLAERVPTGHSVVLCFIFGPLGVLSHMLTRAGGRAWQRRRGAGRPSQAPRPA